MPIDPTRQLVILLYEYFYFNSARLEKEYIELLHYSNMFQRFPERFVRNDVHNLLKSYEVKPDEPGNHSK